MILTRNDFALPLLMQSGVLDYHNTVVLIGSKFSKDGGELQLVQQINAVKRAMSAGQTLVLVNHDNIYEALYEVLNQRYVTKFNDQNSELKFLRLAIGKRSQLCPVHTSFKVIAIADQVSHLAWVCLG